MKFSNTEIGSAKDNLRSPIDDWYKFSAGFSHRLVEEITKKEKLVSCKNSKIFDPFSGCGTTLVSSQKAQIPALGNEGQEFMYDVIRAKLSWKIEETHFEYYLEYIKGFVDDNYKRFDPSIEAHPLLVGLYERDSLTKLYLIRDSLSAIPRKYGLFFKLALSQTLHKVAIHPIAIPYIVRSKTLHSTTRAWECFEIVARKMFQDAHYYRKNKRTSKIYLHDSRSENKNIESGECSVCITSPPYLNNLDYGEGSKVHTHFYGYTKDWSDISKRVRAHLVTCSTTHYSSSEFTLEAFRQSEFYNGNKRVADSLIRTADQLRPICRERGKSFDVLLLLYFRDMFNVLKEIRRVVRRNGKVYLVLGDSAPYGCYIPTTQLIGKISKSLGFKQFRTYRLRSRGSKWKELRFRHSLELPENVLVLQ